MCTILIFSSGQWPLRNKAFHVTILISSLLDLLFVTDRVTHNKKKKVRETTQQDAESAGATTVHVRR